MATSLARMCTQQTQHIYPMFDQCWVNVVDDGPTLVKHWVDVSCVLGRPYSRNPLAYDHLPV